MQNGKHTSSLEAAENAYVWLWVPCDPGSVFHLPANVSAGLKESMRQAELNNWSLDAAQMADLCSSINQFFTATGVIPPQGSTHPQPQVQHQAPPGAPQHGALHAKAGQHGQHNQHINTGRSNGSREWNRCYFICTVRLFNATVMYGLDPVDTHLCVCVLVAESLSQYDIYLRSFWLSHRKHVHGFETERLSDGPTRVPAHVPLEQHAARHDR